jgi:outer membrane lipoprotein
MRLLSRAILAVIPLLLFAGGCSTQDVIPERLEGQVDRDLRYVQVKENPDVYRGKLMLAGGKVLTAKRLKEGTRIEVLQIPLSSDLVPEEGREESESKGRFVAMDTEQNVVDPAVLDDNRLITVVGEVVGSTTVKIDEVEMQVPQLAVKHITVWDRDRLRPYYPYYGYRAPHAWGYRGYYGYPYFW